MNDAHLEKLINRIHESKAGLEIRVDTIRVLRNLAAENERLRAALAQAKDRPFGEAFADARSRGFKTFWWGGREYHTRTAEEIRD